MAFMAANFAMGGDESNLQPGFDYFKKLSDAGSLVAAARAGDVEKGEAGIAILWDYNALPCATPRREDAGRRSGRDPERRHGPAHRTATSSTSTLRTNAAKLFREVYPVREGQILQAQKYARPLVQGLQIPADIAAKFPPDAVRGRQADQ